jgi:hypothetical protein
LQFLPKHLHPRRHTQVWSLFGRELKPVKTFLSEGCHPKIEDTQLNIDHRLLYLDNCSRKVFLIVDKMELTSPGTRIRWLKSSRTREVYAFCHHKAEVKGSIPVDPLFYLTRYKKLILLIINCS